MPSVSKIAMLVAATPMITSALGAAFSARIFAVMIPVEALHQIEDGRYTVFVMENGTPKLRLVEVGLQDITYAEIKSGLEAGEIVTTGIVETQ